MTKEIIIDGVDVSECVSFDKLNGLNICCYDDTREDKIPFANLCVENKDCDFKQLKRAEQKLEKIKIICEPNWNDPGAAVLQENILGIIERNENV